MAPLDLRQTATKTGQFVFIKPSDDKGTFRWPLYCNFSKVVTTYSLILTIYDIMVETHDLANKYNAIHMKNTICMLNTHDLAHMTKTWIAYCQRLNMFNSQSDSGR